MESFQGLSSEAGSWDSFMKDNDLLKLRRSHSSQTGVTLRDHHSRELRGSHSSQTSGTPRDQHSRELRGSHSSQTSGTPRDQHSRELRGSHSSQSSGTPRDQHSRELRGSHSSQTSGAPRDQHSRELKRGHSSHTRVSLRDQHSRVRDVKKVSGVGDSSQNLPRSDIGLYGTFPKIDGRILSICNGCKGVFHPQHIKEHTCSTTRSKATSSQSLKRKAKSKRKTQTSPLPPPPIFQAPLSPSTSATTNEVPAAAAAAEPRTTFTTEVEKPTSPLVVFEPTTVISPTSVPDQVITTTVEICPTSPIISISDTLPHTPATLSPKPATLPPKPVTLPSKPVTLPSKPATVPPKPADLPPKPPTLPPKPPTLPPKPPTLPPKPPTLLPKPPTLPPKPATLPAKHATVPLKHPIIPLKPTTLPPKPATEEIDTNSTLLNVLSSASDIISNINLVAAPITSISPERPERTTSVANPSNRHKKAKKTKIPREYNADINCGVVDSKGICMRSITCSNHRIQQRKLVLGRSKDIQQLIAERKASREKDCQQNNDQDVNLSNNSYGPLVTSVPSPTSLTTAEKDIPNKTNNYIPTLSKAAENDRLTNNNNNSPSTSPPLNPDIPSSEICADGNFNDLCKNVDDGYHSNTNSQEVATNSPHVPIVYMPMSPVSVVSPIQFLQIGSNMVCIESPQPALSPPLPNQSFLWKMPDQITNMKIYKSHPKPAVLPTYGSRKIGGAIILSNQRLENQYNDIQLAIATKRKVSNNATNYKAVSLLNSPHRPNILKVKNRNCKRPSTDKIITSDSKLIRLTPDVNGFILHSDVSEGAEAPQSNNTIQEITLLNIK